MKKILTSFTLLCLTIMLFVTLEVHASNDLVQTAETLDSVTISWSPCEDADCYYIYLIPEDIDYSERSEIIDNYKYLAKLDNTTTSYTISGVDTSVEYDCRLCYDHHYTSYDGEVSETYQSFYGSIDIKFKPAKIKNVNQGKWWYWVNSVDVTFDMPESVDYVEYEFYNSKNKKLESNTSYTNSCQLSNVKNNQFYYVKVRAVNRVNGYSDNERLSFGEWSDKAILFTQPMLNKGSVTSTTKTVNKKKVTTTKLNLKWNKVSGMDKYKVYVSTKEKSGYKLVKTVGSKTNSISISKLGKSKISKNKTYYVYIVGIKKYNGKTYTSGRHYTETVKGNSISTNWTFD